MRRLAASAVVKLYRNCKMLHELLDETNCSPFLVLCIYYLAPKSTDCD